MPIMWSEGYFAFDTQSPLNDNIIMYIQKSECVPGFASFPPPQSLVFRPSEPFDLSPSCSLYPLKLVPTVQKREIIKKIKKN